jgi:hypothetical protein
MDKQRTIMIGGMMFGPCQHPCCNTLVEKRDNRRFCDEHTPECSICLEPVQGSGMDVCGNGHWHHIECLQQLRNLSCPCCRLPLTEATVKAVYDHRLSLLVRKIKRLPVPTQRNVIDKMSGLLDAMVGNPGNYNLEFYLLEVLIDA